MLKVFFDTDNIGMITDMLDAEEHRIILSNCF